MWRVLSCHLGTLLGPVAFFDIITSLNPQVQWQTGLSVLPARSCAATVAPVDSLAVVTWEGDAAKFTFLLPSMVVKDSLSAKHWLANDSCCFLPQLARVLDDFPMN